MRLITRTGTTRRSIGVVSLVTAFATIAAAQAPRGSDGPPAALPVPSALTATPRPRLPLDLSQAWLVPGRPLGAPSKPLADFAAGMRLFAQGKHASALPLFNASALATSPLSAYASYYAGICQLNLSRAAEARATFARLRAARPTGFLAEAAVLREAETASLLGDNAGAAALYLDLAGRKPASLDAVLLALGRARLAAGDRQGAAEALAQLYYELPLSDLSEEAGTELSGLDDVRVARESPVRVKLELGRAERLFAAKRYKPARDAFHQLRPVATGDDAELAALRVAECDHFLGKHKQAREQLTPFIERGSHRAEALFFYLAATRELGNREEYERRSRELVAEFPDSTWAEETLNNLASHFIIADEDDQADATFRELYAKFPRGPRAERAAWKAGWWAYRNGRFRDAIEFFEGAAGAFPRSDYRPSYLYWSGRARAQAGDVQGAASLFRIVTTDYLNTYYGRLAEKRLQAAGIRLVSTGGNGSADATLSEAPPNAEVIRVLIGLQIYDLAREELQYALRTSGESPVVNATLGWVLNREGDLRRGIIYMKRAYPQYMSDEGARLPLDMLRVVYPLDFWPLIRKYAAAEGLDPFLVAALINQESAFDPAIKSSANAIGLMQILPSVGRSYARKVGVRRYSAASLTRPEINVQLGTRYFSDIAGRVGGIPFALACYNAGESRVAEWNAERTGLELDEYIDDIPFPETQTYVRRILGSADDYRRLYGEGTPPVQPPVRPPTQAKPPAKTPPAKKAPARSSKR